MREKSTKSLVIQRFDEEARVWDEVHSGQIEDIIQWEVHRRKILTHEIIRRCFGNKAATILEVGCGAGRNLAELVSENPRFLGKGVDIAPAMIAHCNGRYGPDSRLSFDVLDIEAASLGEKFDVVVLLGVVGYLDSNSLAFINVQRMLRPGGFVIMTYGRRYSLSRSLRRLKRACADTYQAAQRRWNSCDPCSRDASTSNLFRCFSRKELVRSFPSSWRVVAESNVVFGSGWLGKGSVRLSRMLERLFTKSDPFRLALTSLIVASNCDASDSPEVRE